MTRDALGFFAFGPRALDRVVAALRLDAVRGLVRLEAVARFVVCLRVERFFAIRRLRGRNSKSTATLWRPEEPQPWLAHGGTIQ